MILFIYKLNYEFVYLFMNNVQFCTVIGEIASDLMIDGNTKHDISLFSFKARKTDES